MPRSNKDTRIIIERLKDHINQNAPTNEKVKAGLMRVGMLIQARARLNALKAKPPIKDSGHLIESIKYEFFREGDVSTIRVGSFGIPYGAMNEFGGPISEKQRRAMFAAMARRRVQREPRDPPVVGKNSSTGGLYWWPRPFLLPAIRSVEKKILEIISELIGGK